jgi:hypothetical protein
MFVRFRPTCHRLQVSLIETRRVAGKVRHEHVAALGTIEVSPSIADRIAFWSALHQRLAKLANRIDPETHGKILGAIHARIAMPTADEQRALQIENAEADERFWSSVQDMHSATAADHKGLIASAERAVAQGEAEAAEASARAAAAKDRADRIKNGENMAGGLGKPMTREAFESDLLAAGFTKRDLHRMELLAAVGKLGPEVWELFMRSIHASNPLEREAERQAKAVLALFGDCADPAALAKEMLGPGYVLRRSGSR